MNGQIIKALSGFYYVRNENGAVVECKAKGAFRNDEITPLVGDQDVYEITDTQNGTGTVTEILPRKNELIRPAIANVDQVMVVFAVRDPNPNLNILDRFLALMQKQHIKTILVFNKKDLAKMDDIKELKKTYKDAGVKMFFTTLAEENPHLFWLKRELRGKLTVLVGPSGVGKSSMLNVMSGGENAQVGTISARAGRGKQTTRHNEIFRISKSIQIADTPGFTSLLTNDFTKEELKAAFPEFAKFAPSCPFQDCAHNKERDCAVRKAVDDGKISQSRYNTYKAMLGEIKTYTK